MSKNEKELISIIRNSDNPEQALLTAISIIKSVIGCNESD